jgi:hypothetical protein
MSTYVLPAATTSTLGGVIPDGVTITVNSSGVISAATSGSYSNATLTGTTTIQHPADVVTTYSGATGTVTFDFNSGSSVWYLTSVASNFTASFINMPTTANSSYTITLIIVQGGTPYIPDLVSINGVSQTFYWNTSSQPAGSANHKDFFTFNLLYTGGNWLVTGGYATYG